MISSAPYRSSDPLPRFLWGDSLLDFPWNDFFELGDRFEPVEFMAHTHPPRFLCRIADDRQLSGFPGDEEIRVWREEENRTVWKTNFRFYATDFIFFDSIPDDSSMEEVMREACIDRQIRDVFFGMIK